MHNSKRLTRRQCRQIVVSMLYEHQLSGNNPDDILKYRVIEEGFSSQSTEFIEMLFLGIMTQKKKLDDIIGQHLIDWNFERIAPIEKNILRVATFELLSSSASIPPEVIINEAVEISKTFGNTHSSQFINAILDKIATTLNLL